MNALYSNYRMANEYTEVIPNFTKEFNEQFSILMSKWGMVSRNRIVDYGTNGMRNSTWIPPEGYTFTRFIDNGLNLEVLQAQDCHSKNAVLMVHGGSYVYRMHDSFIELMPAYAEAGHRATVVAVDYRVAPEVTYKEMISDIVSAYDWLLNKGYSPSNIIIAGDSSGGGTALAAVLYMRNHGYKLPGGIITLSACTNMACNTNSWNYNNNIDLAFGGNNVLNLNIEKFVGENDYRVPYISPYYGEFFNFPPMLLQVGGAEVLLDDSADIAQKAYEQGVDVKLEIYESMFHDFQNMRGTLLEADIAWTNVKSFMEKVFSSPAYKTKETKKNLLLTRV